MQFELAHIESALLFVVASVNASLKDAFLWQDAVAPPSELLEEAKDAEDNICNSSLLAVMCGYLLGHYTRGEHTCTQQGASAYNLTHKLSRFEHLMVFNV